MGRAAEVVTSRRSEDGVAVLELADPGHRNALSRQLSDALAEAVADALAAGVGALVLTAAPPVFCAGGSLDALLTRSDPLADMFAGVQALAASPVPTIAAVDGAVIGAGVNLPLVCDVVVTTPRARFDPRFLDVGIHPGGGHLFRLTERIGAQGAAAMVLCGDALTGEEAVQHGLAWRCVPQDALQDTALTLARRAAARSPELVRRTKETLRASLALTDPDEAFALELRAQEWSMDQPEFAAALARIRRQITEAR